MSKNADNVAAIAAFTMPIWAGLWLFFLLKNKNFTTQVGKNYRFFWTVTPPLNPTELMTMTTALQAAGGRNVVAANQGSIATAGSHEMTTVVAKEFTLGKPVMTVGDVSLTFTGIKELS